MSKKIIVALFLIALFFTKSFCDINIETFIDKKDISIGDNILLNIKFTLPKKSVLIKPEYDCIKDWYIKDIKVKRDKINYNTYDIVMVITTFKSIINEIPSIEFVFIDENKYKNIIHTKPIEIHITNILSSNVAEIDKLKSIKTVKKLEIKTLYSYIFIIFIFYFLVLLIIHIIKRRRTIRIFNTNRIKKDMAKRIDDILLQDVSLDIKYSELFDIILKFMKIEYKIKSKKKVDDFILEIVDMDTTSITFRVILDILNRIKFLQKENTKLEDTDFIKDANNLKLIIANSME